jgi:hypothetical protein
LQRRFGAEAGVSTGKAAHMQQRGDPSRDWSGLCMNYSPVAAIAKPTEPVATPMKTDANQIRLWDVEDWRD